MLTSKKLRELIVHYTKTILLYHHQTLLRGRKYPIVKDIDILDVTLYADGIFEGIHLYKSMHSIEMECLE